jgi:hypothetical protein
MRLWSLHPKYLDPSGLVALWREALLAQAVLHGRTRGYTRHPQLRRFLESEDPPGSIARYLTAVLVEARARSYSFDESRIVSRPAGDLLVVTDGQLEFERKHLLAKLKVRCPGRVSALGSLETPQAHPLFKVVRGRVEAWDRGK